MDNSGENKKFLVQAKDSGWLLSFQAEFTVRNTPQQNGLVEVKIATIAGRARAMCNGAHMNNETRHYFANEVLSHSTDLDNLIVDKLHIKTKDLDYHCPNGLKLKWVKSKHLARLVL